MTIYFCEGNYFILIILFQHTHQISLHIFVDFTVAGEGTAAFFVAAEGADQVRVLNLFIEVAHEAETVDAVETEVETETEETPEITEE